ncbi:MAG: flagellin [candidate division Zixibacteria bacterium]
MSLRINNNIAAINAHRNLTVTTRALASSMEKLSSGYRINRASDNPAGLVISEQFRAQIAGLGKAIENSEGSINMIQTAEGALNEMNNLLISMRELAIHAANEGFNDTDQLAADQAEIANAIATIDRIAANTQFGTKKLLDGSNANTATITSANSSLVTVLESQLTTGTHSVSISKQTDSTSTLNSTALGLSLSNTDGDPDNLAEGIHNIDVLQASGGATKTSNSVYMQDYWGNGMRLDAASAVGTINSSTAGVVLANDVSVTVSFRVQESGSSISQKQAVTVALATGDSVTEFATKFNTAIASNSALNGKIEASVDTGRLIFGTVNAGTQYSFEVNDWSGSASVGTFAAGTSVRGVSTNALDFDVDSENVTLTASTMTVAAGTYTTLDSLITALDAASGTAYGNIVGTVREMGIQANGDDKINFLTNDEGSDYSVKMVDIGGTDSLRQALALTLDTTSHSGTDALIALDGYNNSISSVKYNTTGTATLANKAGDSSTVGRGTVDMIVGTSVNGIDLGNLLLDVSAPTFSVSLDGAPGTSATGGVDALVYNRDRTESLKLNIGLRSTGGSETINNVDQSLVFQIGANVGQTAKIGISNMAASTLGRGIAGVMFTNLSQIDVTTALGAQDSQMLIDTSINEVSTLRGTLGSFQKNALESNLRNLRIAKQNLTASESTIRDTDMAAEMSTFVKNQILLQAGTAMLAQANQVPQVVLSLFG